MATNLDTRKVEFAQHENDTDNRTYRTGSVNDKEQRVSRFRRLTTGSLRYKNRANQMSTTAASTAATTTSTTKTDFIEPVQHSIDPLQAFLNSDTEISDSGVPRLNDTPYLNNGRRPKRYRRSGRSPYETPNYSTALGPLREKHKLTPLERIFLEAAERGDKSTLIRCLSFSNSVNVNCVNILGRTAIQIAVDNENIELVELLLDQPGIEIGDAILYAIQEGVYRIVEMLIDHPSITKEMLGTSWTTQCIGIGKREEESHDFPADISPVMLAAICNQFEILQLLINRGARIEEPHKSSCSCEHCHRLLSDDPLKHTLQRINTYRALASPAWISLTSPDPILTAFELSSELLHLASRENEFKETFLSLCEQCRKYACDLLDLCRGTGEVVAVLSKGTDSDESCSEASSDESDDNQTAGKMHNLTVPSNHISAPCYSPNCHCHQSNNDNGNTSICNQSDSNQNYGETENDWRELLERSNFSRKRHHRRYTAWNHPTYSCSKFNQALSIESQHSICDDSASTTNLHPSTSKSERLNYSDNSMNDSDHLQLPVDQTTSYTLAKLPSFVTRDFKDSQTHSSPTDNNDDDDGNAKLKNTSRKRISNEDRLPTILNTSEGCSSIFFERKRNSFDWESPTSGFNQRLPSNTTINTSQSKHELYERNSFNNSNNNNMSSSATSTTITTERDINLNRNTPTTTVRRFDCETHEPTESHCIKQQRKFYSFKLDRLKLAIKHEQKKI
ncbi:unnamed protein product [Trichobilharzia szidati]|nr:unnamed protein product [Trichobilharzia szidati]